MMGLGRYSVGTGAPRFAVRSGGNLFSIVLWAAPCAEAQQVSAALSTSAPLANAVPDAPTPLLSLAHTAAQTTDSKSAGWQVVPVAAASVQHGAGK